MQGRHNKTDRQLLWSASINKLALSMSMSIENFQRG